MENFSALEDREEDSHDKILGVDKTLDCEKSTIIHRNILVLIIQPNIPRFLSNFVAAML